MPQKEALGPYQQDPFLYSPLTPLHPSWACFPFVNEMEQNLNIFDSYLCQIKRDIYSSVNESLVRQLVE